MIRNYSNIGWFIVSIVLATLFATVTIVAGTYMVVGIGRAFYNIMTILLSSAIPAISGLYLGL